MTTGVPHKPWYREPWPWLLMAGPFIVVVAGVVTAWLAVVSDDGLVAGDYYKQGLAVNQLLARAERARAMELEAQLRLSARSVEVRLSAREGVALPPVLALRLSHPTHADLDQVVSLQGEGGRYAASLAPLASGRWRVQLEDEAKTWRLVAELLLPRDALTHVAARP